MLEGQADQRLQFMKEAARHAKDLLDAVAGQNLSRINPYFFGDSYNSAQSMVVYAAVTLGEYLLDFEDAPKQALTIINIGMETQYGSNELWELKVRVLLRLGQEDDAFRLHKDQRLALDEVLESARYQAFVGDLDSAEATAKAARIAAITIHTMPGKPASQSDLARLKARFPPLPAEYVNWICRAESHELQVRDDDNVECYRLFSVDEALEKHEEVLNWIHLHDKDWPEGAAEIHESIRESGMDPLRLVPIVGNDRSPDCFLLRLDGAERGSVYFWGHDELPAFEFIVDGAEGLFPWLQARAEVGDTFIL